MLFIIQPSAATSLRAGIDDPHRHSTERRRFSRRQNVHISTPMIPATLTVRLLNIKPFISSSRCNLMDSCACATDKHAICRSRSNKFALLDAYQVDLKNTLLRKNKRLHYDRANRFPTVRLLWLDL